MPGGMQLGMHGQGPEWYAVYAWAFLEDVYRMRTATMASHSRPWQCARMLGACVTNLRNACEAHFGGMKQAPKDDMVWFITGVRGASAHGGKPGVLMQPESISIKWNDAERTGWIEADTTLTMQFEDATKGNFDRAAAQAFLTRHSGRLYPALHEATRAVAKWTGATLDGDFETIGKMDFARHVVRLPLQSRQQHDRFIQASRGHGAFTVDLAELPRQPWSIHGRWVDSEAPVTPE